MIIAVRSIVVCAALWSASAAFAQPASVVDLGDISIGQSERTPGEALSAGGAVWYRFRLTSAITPLANWLDLDTPRSLTSSGAALNTEVAIYDERANKVAEDDYSGGGVTPGDSRAAALSFGGGSGIRLGEDGPGWFGSRISNGWNQVANTQLPTLPAGVYYVVITGFNASFPDPNPLWQDPSTTSTASGVVHLRVATGSFSQRSWNEAYRGIDAGDTIATAQVVEGSGRLDTILTNFGVPGRDMYKINICDPASFQVRATPTASWGNTFNVQLFIFDAAGVGVVAINNTFINPTPDTVLTLPANTPAGDYYIAINNYCHYSTPDVPAFDALNRAIWDFSHPSTWNIPLPPNGAGGASPLDHWLRLGSGCQGVDAYFVRLAFTGACFVPTGPVSCPGDLDADGVVGLQDLAILLASFGMTCP